MSTSLSLKFELTSGEERTISISIPKDGVTADEVSSAMASIITNGNAFSDPPVTALKATLTETNSTVLVDNE